MTRSHLNLKGELGRCSAENGKCPYKDQPHFNSKEEYTEYMESQYEKLGGLEKNDQNNIKVNPATANNTNNTAAEQFLDSIDSSYKEKKLQQSMREGLSKEIIERYRSEWGRLVDLQKHLETLDYDSAEYNETNREYFTLEERLKRETGYSENPEFGVPINSDTSIFDKRRAASYSSNPTKRVSVLEKGKQICKKCNGEMIYDKSSGTFGSWRHVDGGDCNGSTSGVCSYCGTTDPKHLSFKMQNYSDESHCSRCGGVRGYAIGD